MLRVGENPCPWWHWLSGSSSLIRGDAGIAIHLALWFTRVVRAHPGWGWPSWGWSLGRSGSRRRSGPRSRSCSSASSRSSRCRPSEECAPPSRGLFRNGLTTILAMPVRVRMAPSPTGLLHIEVSEPSLFNWLFARGLGGECLLRIENTDTSSREVRESVEQIERLLRWLDRVGRRDDVPARPAEPGAGRGSQAGRGGLGVRG